MPKYVIIPSPDATVSFTVPPGTGTAKTFECQVTSAAVTRTANTVTVPATGCEGPTTKESAPTYALVLNWLQDWGQTNSLSQFLQDNELVDADFEVAVGAAPMTVAKGVCQLVPGDYGGDFSSALTATATMGITGTPTFTPGTTTLAAEEPVGAAAF